MIVSRDQKFAKDVFERVSAFKQQNEQSPKKVKQYGSMSHKLPVMIRKAGLAQALAFVEAKGKKREAYRLLLADLEQSLALQGGKRLVAQSREVNLDEYMFLTQNALAALLWFKRYAQSVLDVETTDEADDDDEDDDNSSNQGEQGGAK
jgi:CRISPR-associated protein Cmr5